MRLEILSPPRRGRGGRWLPGPVVRWVAPYREFDPAAGAAWEADLRGRPRSAEPLQWDGVWTALLTRADAGILLDPRRLELVAGWSADAWTTPRSEHSSTGRWGWLGERAPDLRTWSQVGRAQRRRRHEYMEVLVRQRGRRSAAVAVFWVTEQGRDVAHDIAGRLGLVAQPIRELGIALARRRKRRQRTWPGPRHLMDEVVGAVRRAILAVTGREDRGVWGVRYGQRTWFANPGVCGRLAEIHVTELEYGGAELKIEAACLKVDRYHIAELVGPLSGRRYTFIHPARRARAVRRWAEHALRAELDRPDRGRP